MDAELKWEDSAELEEFNPLIKFIEEWNYFDYHRDRWEDIS